MKKIFIGLFAFVLVIHPIFLGTSKAQTLGDLKAELEQKQQELLTNQQNKVLTEQEISNVNASISSIKKQIEQTYAELNQLQIDIETLNEQIIQKEQEVKDIINFVQISNGESAYLEYIFGAKDFTDFIYRVAISEQLTAYNDRLIDEYNEMIEINKQKQVSLNAKQGQLASSQKALEEKLKLLGQKIENLHSVGVDIEDSIEYQKEIIALYESKGCKPHEDIATCGRKVLPQGTAFYRPTVVGRITSEWGPRDLLGRTWHEGIDVGVSVGTQVYSVANGMVAKIAKSTCGGNMVVVHHEINKATYTSVYAHLSSVAVGEGQTVDRNTIIGYSGGAPGGYDKCTTGPHLHLTVAKGLYGVDYYDWSYELNVKYSINPRTVINFPAGRYNPWDDRITAY